MSVLVVEDDLTMSKAITEAVACLGYVAEPVFSGDEAVERLGREPRPSIVLLDLSIPPSDGNVVLQAVHEMADPPPVVLVSSCDGCRDVPAADTPAETVVKPALSTEIVSLVDKYATKVEVTQ